MNKNLKDIKTEQNHNNSVYIKRLITLAEKKGKITTYNYAWIEKGKQLEVHSHPDGEEFFLFLEGRGEVLIGDKWIPVEKDDFITVPANSDHSVKNNHADNLVFISLRTLFD